MANLNLKKSKCSSELNVNIRLPEVCLHQNPAITDPVSLESFRKFRGRLNLASAIFRSVLLNSKNEKAPHSG